MVSVTPGTSWSLLGTRSAFNPQNEPIMKELTDIKGGRYGWMHIQSCIHRNMLLKYNLRQVFHNLFRHYEL